MNATSAYRQDLGRTANPVRLVVLLYEQVIRDLQEAAAAIANGNIESRTKHLNHALQVLCELNGSLDMDQGEVAQNLARFYELVRFGLLQVQLHPDRAALEKHIANLLSLREAWVEVERRTAAISAEAVVTETSAAAPGISATAVRSDWRA
jgi:flagellar protein FliS